MQVVIDDQNATHDGLPPVSDALREVSRRSNRLLQLPPAAEFQSLHPHLETVELAKGTVWTEAGSPVQPVYLPHGGIASVMVSLSEGQRVAVAMIGLVSYNRGHIEIREIDGLRKTSCECYAAVRRQCDRLLNPAGWRSGHRGDPAVPSREMSTPGRAKVRLFVNSSCRPFMARSSCILARAYCIFWCQAP
jgi:hypothetical protein